MLVKSFSSLTISDSSTKKILLKVFSFLKISNLRAETTCSTQYSVIFILTSNILSQEFFSCVSCASEMQQAWTQRFSSKSMRRDLLYPPMISEFICSPPISLKTYKLSYFCRAHEILTTIYWNLFQWQIIFPLFHL